MSENKRSAAAAALLLLLLLKLLKWAHYSLEVHGHYRCEIT